MPVCKFFIRGNCRKGNSCNFDHVIPDQDYGYEYSGSRGTSVLKRDEPSYDSYDRSYSEPRSPNVYRKYNERHVQGHTVNIQNDYYNQPQQRYDQYSQRYSNDRYHYDPRQRRDQSSAPKSPDISMNDLYALLKADIGVIEKCHIWPLTSFCVVKLFGSLEDWHDYSPEELRLAAYLAKASNNVEGYKATLDKIVNRAQAVRDFYKNTSKETSNKLREYMQQQPSTVFTVMDNELDFSRVNLSLLNAPPSIPGEFSNPQPISQQPTEDTEMSQSTHKDDVFGGSNLAPSVSFASVQDPKNQNIFGGYAQDTNQTFGAPDKVFGSASSGGIFGSSQPVSSMQQAKRDFKQVFPGVEQAGLDVALLSLMWRGDSPYSRKDELTEEELEQFKASKFTIGKVPLLPPPKELC